MSGGLSAASVAVDSGDWAGLAMILAGAHLRGDWHAIAAIVQAHRAVAAHLHPGFCWIPPGRSVVGGRTVGSARPLLVQRRPVSLVQWRAETGSLRRWLGGRLEVVTWRDDHTSVEGMTWGDAIALCQQWSAREAVPGAYTYGEAEGNDHFYGPTRAIQWRGPGAEGYRLPTESEWLYAATGDGSGFVPSEVSTVPRLPGASRYWGATDHFFLSHGFPHAISGRHPPSRFGLLDRYGGVLEWCWDVFSDYWIPVPIPEDPDGVTMPLHQTDPWHRSIKSQWDCLHVCAGGARFLSAADCHPEERRGSGADFNYAVGLRMVRSAVLPGDELRAVAAAILSRGAAMLEAASERLQIAAAQLRERPADFSPAVPDGPPHYGSAWGEPAESVPRQARIDELTGQAESLIERWEAVEEAAESLR